jgi:hypothetical protein
MGAATIRVTSIACRPRDITLSGVIAVLSVQGCSSRPSIKTLR